MRRIRVIFIEDTKYTMSGQMMLQKYLLTVMRDVHSCIVMKTTVAEALIEMSNTNYDIAFLHRETCCMNVSMAISLIQSAKLSIPVVLVTDNETLPSAALQELNVIGSLNKSIFTPQHFADAVVAAFSASLDPAYVAKSSSKRSNKSKQQRVLKSPGAIQKKTRRKSKAAVHETSVSMAPFTFEPFNMNDASRLDSTLQSEILLYGDSTLFPDPPQYHAYPPQLYGSSDSEGSQSSFEYSRYQDNITPAYTDSDYEFDCALEAVFTSLDETVYAEV